MNNNFGAPKVNQEIIYINSNDLIETNNNRNKNVITRTEKFIINNRKEDKLLTNEEGDFFVDREIK